MFINWMALFGISLHAALLQGYDVIINVYPNNPPKSPARSSGAGAAGAVGAAAGAVGAAAGAANNASRA